MFNIESVQFTERGSHDEDEDADSPLKKKPRIVKI